MPGEVAPTVPGPRRFGRSQRLAVGLLLTLIGLFLLADLFPTSPGALARLLPVGAAGILAVWLGGILLGTGSRA